MFVNALREKSDSPTIFACSGVDEVFHREIAGEHRVMAGRYRVIAGEHRVIVGEHRVIAGKHFRPYN